MRPSGLSISLPKRAAAPEARRCSFTPVVNWRSETFRLLAANLLLKQRLGVTERHGAGAASPWRVSSKKDRTIGPVESIGCPSAKALNCIFFVQPNVVLG